MLLEVSIGEVIDKHIILEIKREKITDLNKKNEIIQELSVFKLNDLINKYDFYYNFLKYINLQIWNMTDDLQKITYENETYAKKSYELFNLNQNRYRLKNIFNILLDSTLKEQKSVNSKICNLIIDNEEIIYDKIPEINHLFIDYDFINIKAQYKNILNKISNCPTLIFYEELPDSEINIFLNELTLDNNIRDIFDNTPLSYKFAGKLGDFIQTLSIVNEKFYETGKKGIIYIHKNETWGNGLQNTYNDTYSVIKSQRYVKDYKIFNNERIDIEGDVWFFNPLLYNANWAMIFNDTFNIDWGKRKWIDVKIDEKWKDVVLINEMHYRRADTINFSEIKEKFSKIIFIGYDKQSYDLFTQQTKLDIPWYVPTSFEDLCIAVNSCSLLVGGLSAILTIGHATHKKRIIGLKNNLRDNVHNIKLDKFMENVYY